MDLQTDLCLCKLHITCTGFLMKYSYYNVVGDIKHLFCLLSTNKEMKKQTEPIDYLMLAI